MVSRAISIFGQALRSVALFALAAAPFAASAQVTESADTTVSIIEDVTLSKTRDMDFGRIIAPSAGFVVMQATDAALCTPNNAIVLLDPCQSAAFEGTGASSFQIRVRVPARRRTILTGPGRNLRLRRITVGEGDGLNFIRRAGRNYDFEITDPAGNFEFFVGGRLLIRNDQEPGVYTGTFDVEVDYQ